MVKHGREPCQVILNPLLRKPRHFCRASSRHPRVGQHRLGNLPRSIGQAIRQQENLSCFLDSFLTSRLVFFGSLATDGMDDRPVSHAGTKLATDQPVLSDCTRPRPAGGKGIVQFLSPRARTHAGTKPASDQPVISECTRPRPAGGEKGICKFHSPRARTHAGTIEAQGDRPRREQG